MAEKTKHGHNLKDTLIKHKIRAFVFILLLVIAGLVYAFWGPELRTWIVILIAAIIEIIIILSAAVKKNSIKILYKKKRKLLEEMRVAEKHYLKRKISKDELEEILQEKQTEIIKLDAEIDKVQAKEAKKFTKKEVKKLKEIDSRRKHLLNELLDEKRMLLKEREIAEKKYQKRKLSEETFKKILSKNKKQLIEVQANIRELYKENSIEEIMTELKTNLAQVETKQKKRKTKEIDIMVEDIVENQ